MKFIIAIVLFAALLIVANRYIERQRASLGDDAPPRVGRRSKDRPKPEADVEPDFVRPRPNVASFHVRGDEAQVTFAIPFPAEGDDILADLLVSEAIEVVREKRHVLPIGDVTDVVALAGDPASEVGRTSLVTPGVLPPPSKMGEILNLHQIGTDPISASFDQVPDTGGSSTPRSSGDDLEPVGTFIRLPKAVTTGLRTQGIDPDTMSATDLVTGILTLFGYSVSDGAVPGQFLASKGGTTTFILADNYLPGDYPEVEDDIIRRFILAFDQSKANRGMLVSDKYGPFSVYEHERRDPRVRFVTRERLQKLVDSMALG